MAGSFGSPGGNGVDSGLAVLGEVFEAFGWLEAETAQQRQRCVAQGGEDLRGLAGVGSRLALAAGDIADVVQAVLDAPNARVTRREDVPAPPDRRSGW